jgi:hypothetical protein
MCECVCLCVCVCVLCKCMSMCLNARARTHTHTFYGTVWAHSVCSNALFEGDVCVYIYSQGKVCADVHRLQTKKAKWHRLKQRKIWYVRQCLKTCHFSSKGVSVCVSVDTVSYASSSHYSKGTRAHATLTYTGLHFFWKKNAKASAILAYVCVHWAN